MISDNRMIASGMLCLAALAPVAAAFAQPLQRVDVESVAVVRTSLQPVVGEEVLDESGALDTSFFVENRICTVRGCRVYIFDKRSGALVYNNGAWSDAYERTERAKQVIRVKPFTNEERPKPAPDDKALEEAPAIKKVVRPPDDKKL